MKDFTKFIAEQSEQSRQMKIGNIVYTVDNDYKLVLKVKALTSKKKDMELSDLFEKGIKLLLGNEQFEGFMSTKPSFPLVGEVFKTSLKMATGTYSEDEEEDEPVEGK